MNETLPEDPRDETCHVVTEEGEHLPAQISRANAIQYAEILNATHPEGISHTIECRPVSVVDLDTTPPPSATHSSSFAPGSGTRGI